MWHDTAATRRLGLRYPIVQGPFGGGLSSPALAAAVAGAGGLGSFGAQGMTPARITEVIGEIRALTPGPFAINLWVSTEDEGVATVTREQYEAALTPLRPLFEAVGAAPPAFPLARGPRFEDQAQAVLDARPPVFSFIFGVPPADLLEACRARGILTVGTVTTVEEAIAVDQAGVDLIVASGFEAGGHRSSFLKPAEQSLTGTFALIPQVVDAVRTPVIAAGGIADGRGVAAALALGAAGVQIGTAFLACDESNALPAHKAALRTAHAARPASLLTRAFTGRLARGFSNSVSEAVLHAPHVPHEAQAQQPARTSQALQASQAARAAYAETWLPYPLQGTLVSALRDAAIARGRFDLITMWGGQAAPLVRHQKAADLFASLIAETERVLASGARI